MFINCPYCRALVATDPATDLPPERCPRCAAVLRESTEPDAMRADTAPAPSPSRDAVPPAPTVTIAPSSVQPAPIATSVVPATPTRPIATLLKLVGDVDAGAADNARATEDDAIVEPATAQREPNTPETGADAPPATATNAEHAPATAAAPVSGLPTEVESTEPVAAAADTALPAPPRTAPAAPSREARRAAPSFAQSVAARPQTRGWMLPAAAAALSLLLLLQLALAQRAQLAADARWRPAISALCGVLRCALPPWREPAAFVLVDRDVRPRADRPGVLRVTATFRNDARWPQPWPQVALTLSDLDGNPVAARAFAPRDYLGAAPTQAELASGQQASIAMDVVEPDARSVAFDFALR